ncbi:DUF1102 domain-containing protein [Thermococcus barossii]|uniref:DUF1102 domain-containing protein n=1 Tax=Thermococcus barossii TaxID=54077 RepID=A0A2Z2MBA5_9EURY|nr:DUF1102 domain-containing protein [Thermococcus barossii]ASJ03880.1 hypothetical protein A3L01_00270 [Thermococcus barossii]
MRTTKKVATGVGITVILLIGLWGLYPSRPITVVYAIPEDGNGMSFIESPLPPYSYLNDEGFLVVDISPNNPFYPGYGEGLSVNSTYVFEKVFVIKNNESITGESEICVRITSETPEIGFFGGSFDGNWGEVVEVSISAGESVEIGARIDTHGLSTGDYTENFIIEAWGGSCG